MSRKKANSRNTHVRHKSQQDKEATNSLIFSRRLFVVALAIIAGITALISRAYYLQVIKHRYYSTRSNRNRVKVQIIPPLRGNIFDRNNIALSENILSYQLVVNRSQNKNTDELVDKLTAYMRFNEDDRARYEKDKKTKNHTQNVIVRQDLTEDEINLFLIDLHYFPGFDIVPSYKRYYPYGELTSHVVGYINNISKKDLKNINTQEYSGTTKIGRTGIEKYYEESLHGKAGLRQAEVSRTGKIIRILEHTDPIPGEDLYLSLDIRLQEAIHSHLENEEHNGAGVAIDPRNGEVIAMYSNPSFDANLFVDGISHSDYKTLLESPRKNLFNRALNGQYSPASSIKPMMVLAALHDYIAAPDTQIECKGSYKIPEYQSTKRFFCWKRSGHGSMDAYSSVVQSCDVYYYTIGKALGVARIHEYLSQFGLGKKTGVDLPSESEGILPTKEWKQNKYGKPWFIGDTINISIGQGYMLTTPFQLAYFTAILGAQGKRFKPHLLTHRRSGATGEKSREPRQSLSDVQQNNPEAWKTVHESLIGVINSSKGTARKLRFELPFEIAGKTGTAQVFSFKNNKRIKKNDLRKKLRDNSVFIAYVPAENPVIALAVILENAGGGSEAAAPVAVKILKDYFANQSTPKKEPTPDSKT